MLNCKTTSVFVLAAILLNRAGLAKQDSCPTKLRVISYNVQFLPQIVAFANKRSDPQYRATTIGTAMSQYDIIGLNELFADRPKELLLGELKKIWGESMHVYLSPQVDPNRYAGGLALISRFPIMEKNVHTYTQFSKPEEKGIRADGFVTKGVIHGRISVPESATSSRLIDVFVTHLESQDPSVRPSQYAECADFIKQHSSPDRPAIILGDFNTRGNQAEMDNSESAYHQLLTTLGAARPDSKLLDLWKLFGTLPGGTSDQLKEDGGNRIDYIFLLNPSLSANELIPKEVSVNRFLDSKVVALSDHSAVESVLQLAVAPTAKKRIILIGDSTVKNGQGNGEGGLWGWGQFLAEHFDLDRVEVENRALGGRSSRTFLTEGLWAKSLERLRPGDYVLIQFGHNDGGQMFETDRPRASIKGNGEETQEGIVKATGKTEVVHSFGWYLRTFIAEAKSKGAVPIVCSLVPRNRWQDGKVIRSRNDYAAWAAAAAIQSGAFFIDLNELIALKYEQLGKEKIDQLFFTEKDWTHTTKHGAQFSAQAVADALRELNQCDLKSYLN